MSSVLQAGMGVPDTLDLTPDRTLATRQRRAVHDLLEAARLWRLCWTLAWLDIKLRYRGSVLGPFWLTLSTAIMVGAMGFIYATLFHMSLHEYLPFLALSLVLWNYVSAVVSDACTGFTVAEGMIRSIRMPFTLYAARIVVRNLLILAHNILVIVVTYLLLSVQPGLVAFMALPGFGVWLVDAVALALLLGALCARFRDIPPIVGSIMQMVFFVTPVIWKPEILDAAKRWVLPFNPFYTLLEIVRGPLLGTMPPAMIWVSALLSSVVLVGVSWLAFLRARSRIAFWV